MKLVSIGLPTYNGEPFIKETLQSLLNQTYPHFELIISDDHSTDKTVALCREFKKKDARIHIFRQKKQLGFARNFNYTLDRARADYFMWAGQDDLWDKRYLQTLMELVTRHTHAISAVTNYNNFFEGKKYPVTLHHFSTSYQDTFNTTLHFIRTNNLSYFYGLHTTKKLKAIGGYQLDSRPFFKSSDYMTIFKMCIAGGFVFSNKTLYFKRDTGTFTNRFNYLHQLQFNKKIRTSIVRYLTFPVSFLYDVTYSLKSILTSDFNLLQKIALSLNIMVFFLRRNLVFLISLFQGLIYIIKGLTKR